MSPDLNSDLGEGEPWDRTSALLRLVTSANIACGGHAGDLASMERSLLLAAKLGVRAGAHPGLPGSFGRGEAPVSPAQLALLVLHQLGGLHRIAQVSRVRLHHVKLHGSLYHATESDPRLAEAYLGTLRDWFPGLRVYARAGGKVVRRARLLGVPVWEEAFVDRGYRSDGTLVPRTEPGALIEAPAAAAARVRRYSRDRCVESVDGADVSIRADTWCVHGDGLNAVAVARAVRRALGIPGARR